MKNVNIFSREMFQHSSESKNNASGKQFRRLVYLVLGALTVYNAIRLFQTKGSMSLGPYSRSSVDIDEHNMPHTIGMDNNHSSDLGEITTVPIALSFTLQSDIDHIMHNPKRREIHVFLNAKRKCKRPKLRGRLSGLSLTLLTWEHDSIFYNNLAPAHPHLLIGKYQVPDGGTYFLELIALFCEAPLYHEAFDMTCLEDTANHTITARGASIYVLPPIEGTELSENYPLGFWKLRNTSRSTGGTGAIETGAALRPVYTRKQLVGCFEISARKAKLSLPFMSQATEKNINQTLFIRDPKECEEAYSLVPFNNYSFVWNNASINDVVLNNNGKLVGDFKQFHKGNQENVCFIGMSHSRNVRDYVRTISNFMEKMRLTPLIRIRFQYWKLVVYDAVVNSNTSTGIVLGDYGKIPSIRRTHKCSRAVLTIGNWAASCWGGAPLTFYQYEERMKQFIIALRESGIEPILRSLIPYTMFELGSYCPPLSWESHAIDGYNEILLRLSQDMNVTFIDLRFLTDTVGDTHPDRCHSQGELLWRESNIIMRYLIESQ